MMNKNEADVEKAQIVAAVNKYHYRMEAVAGTSKVIGYCAAVYFITDMLKAIATAQPAALHELAEVVKSLQLHQWLSWSVTGLATVAWLYERSGKRRGYRKNDELRSDKEAADPHKAPSGLLPDGRAPDE